MFRANVKQMVAGGSALFALLFVAGPVFAQLEEVIVTAERREQSLQEVPIAVTVFTAGMVESLKISDFKDLSFKIPGFSINTFSKTRHNPALRGGSSSLASAGAENAVGLYIDDVYYGGSADFEIEFFDIERIEVLRGPQGTLFGRNSTGGSINVTTKDPGDELTGKFQVELGNYNLNKLGGYIAAPISDNLSGSLAILATHRNGTSFNSVTNNDVDNLNRTSIRGKLVWTLPDDLEIKVGISHSTVDETGVARDATSAEAHVDLDVLADQGFRIDGEPRIVQMFTDGRYVHKQWVGSLHIEKGLGDMTFQSITTGRSFVAEQEPVSLAGVPTPIFAIADEHDLETFTQEFRLLNSDADSALQWQVGTYILNSNDLRTLGVITRWDESVAGGAFSAIFGCPDQLGEDFENFVVTQACIDNYPELFDENPFTLLERVKTTSYSAYAQATYDFSEQFSATIGGRYTYDKKKLKGSSLGEYDWAWNPLPGQSFANSADWDEFTWRAALSFRPTDRVLVYGSASTGWRSGAYDMAQTDGALVDQAVAPETVISYEIGLKSRFFGDRIQLNVALFESTYEDLQFFVNTIGQGGEGSLTTNAGEAKVEGVEIELQWMPVDQLTLYASYSNQDGTSKDIPPEAEIPEGTPPQGTVPESYILGLDFEMDAGNGGGWYFHADYVVKDEYSLEFIDNSIPQFRTEIDGMLGANIGYNSGNGWGVQVWGKNLTNEIVILYGQDFWFSLYGPSLGNDALFSAAFGPRYSDPRTYGVTVSYEF